MRAVSPASLAMVMGPLRFFVDTSPMNIFLIMFSVRTVLSTISPTAKGKASIGPCRISRYTGPTPRNPRTSPASFARLPGVTAKVTCAPSRSTSVMVSSSSAKLRA